MHQLAKCLSNISYTGVGAVALGLAMAGIWALVHTSALPMVLSLNPTQPMQMTHSTVHGMSNREGGLWTPLCNSELFSIGNSLSETCWLLDPSAIGGEDPAGPTALPSVLRSRV